METVGITPDNIVQQYEGYVSDAVFHGLNLHIDLLPEIERAQAETLLANDFVHGRSHIERLLKWVSVNTAKLEEANDPIFSQFNGAAIEAVKRHDYIEVVADKENHGDGGTMYSLATDTVVQNNFEAYAEAMGITLTKDEWVRNKWATAFMIQYHRPEGMPTTDEIFQRGYLLDVARIREGAEQFKYTYEPYGRYEEIFDQLCDEEQPTFTRDEIEAIRTHAYLVALADKLDQNFPVEVSSNRTILLNPDRPMYLDKDKGGSKGGSAEYDFVMRRNQGGNDVCDDDFSRMLFEMSRTDAFSGAPKSVREIYGTALRAKALFLQNAISEFIDGDFRSFTRFYDQEEYVIQDDILAKLNYPPESRRHIIKGGRHTIARVLAQFGEEPEILYAALQANREEQKKVHMVLERKYRNFPQHPFHKKRIKELVNIAISTMQSNLDIDESVKKLQPPYGPYHPIHLNGSYIQ